jgi:hypothetical protein
VPNRHNFLLAVNWLVYRIANRFKIRRTAVSHCGCNGGMFEVFDDNVINQSVVAGLLTSMCSLRDYIGSEQHIALSSSFNSDIYRCLYGAALSCLSALVFIVLY